MFNKKKPKHLISGYIYKCKKRARLYNGINFLETNRSKL